MISLIEIDINFNNKKEIADKSKWRYYTMKF